MPTIAITEENLDEIFPYHERSPEQVEKGSAIRAAAKELCRVILQSGPSKYNGPTPEPDLALLARQCRKDALQAVREAAMIANSAITYEAKDLERA